MPTATPNNSINDLDSTDDLTIDELLTKIKRPGSSFYYSVLYLQEQDKLKLCILFALFQEWLSLHDNSKEPQVAHTALEWWLVQLNHFAGYDNNSLPEHPLLLKLHRIILQDQEYTSELKLELGFRLMGIVSAFLNDQHQYSTEQDLLTFLAKTWGNFNIACGLLLKKSSQDAIAIQEHIGVLIGYHHILKQLANQLTRSRCPIPQNWLNEKNLSSGEVSEAFKSSDIYSAQQTARSHILNRFQTEIHKLAEALKDFLQDTSRAQAHTTQQACSLPGLTILAIEIRRLAVARKKGFKIFDYRLQLSPLRKLWIAWRCRRYVRVKKFSKLLA